MRKIVSDGDKHLRSQGGPLMGWCPGWGVGGLRLNKQRGKTSRTPQAGDKARWGKLLLSTGPVREGLAEEVTFGQEAHGGEGVCCQALRERAFRTAGTASAKPRRAQGAMEGTSQSRVEAGWGVVPDGRVVRWETMGVIQVVG